MSFSERACNWLLGLSALGWSVRAIVTTEPEARWSAVPLTLCALNLLVGILFLVRGPLRVAAQPLHLAGAIPSFLLGGIAMRLAPESPWPLYAQILFATGGAFTFTALVFLGRSFAILPGVREVVVRGPYRWIRHPAYAGECIMLCGACSASVSSLTIGVALAAIGFLVVRVLVEEATLLRDDEYQAYARSHRWRLVPFVW